MFNGNPEEAALVSSEEKGGKKEGELDPKYQAFQEKSLILLKDKNYDLVITMMDQVIQKYPEIFFEHDSEFEIQYNKFKGGFDTVSDVDGYEHLIRNFIMPFWKKVNAAGSDIISDEYFHELTKF